MFPSPKIQNFEDFAWLRETTQKPSDSSSQGYPSRISPEYRISPGYWNKLVKNINASGRTGGIESALSLTTRACRRSILAVLRSFGVSAFVAQSRWRNRRLLILCYHGVSLEDEHEWSPGLYVSPVHFENRLRVLKRSANVLPLDEGLKRLAEGSLPDRSVALTFDDGFHDFYARALPLLTKYGIPATVHLTTYYSDFRRPVFELICSYMLWKRRHMILEPLPISNWTSPVNLAESRDREFVHHGAEPLL